MFLGLAMPADARPVDGKAVVGCWDVSQPHVDAKLQLDRKPGGGLHAVATFKNPSRGPSRIASDARRVMDQLEVSCRPTSQHGSFCRIQPDGSGLRVLVYAFRYNDRTRGHLVENFVAQRCR
ncbi:MAG: hypothetical protein SFX73_37590 [Kofleriaceae bacterium]|nr:hypothetical protein [Kofleriaceae bacterium]